LKDNLSNRSHLNAELLEKGNPFLLGDAFFEDNQGERNGKKLQMKSQLLRKIGILPCKDKMGLVRKMCKK
jgi:hypothetical protein